MTGSPWTRLRRIAADLRSWFFGLIGPSKRGATPAGNDRDDIGPNRSGPQAAYVTSLETRFSGRHVIRWSLGADWFIAVGTLHALLAVVLGTLLSPWWIVACGASFAFKFIRARPGETYLLIAFDDHLEVRRHGDVLRLAGACWMTRRWLVIPTTRRVLPVRRGRLSAQDFARLRRSASG